MLSKNLLESAVEFHGHLGPYLVLGLRAGLLGTKYLGKSYFELKATVETDAHPPRSCFIDGVQFSSGCTTGKGNLKVKAGCNVSVEFVRSERRIYLIVKDDILGAVDHLASEKEIESLSQKILEKTDEELFLIKPG
jgi:formylmethanofuran dehydrogenase subunit E